MMKRLFQSHRFVSFRKLISAFVVLTFIVSLVVPPTIAQVLPHLPQPGQMVWLTPTFEPPVLKGMTLHNENPLLFDFIVDRGQDEISRSALKDESTKLIKYFLAALTIPDQDAWVNLSPYEKDRIIPDALGQTEMGRQMLEQDYVLKQLSASLTNPDKELGQKFWNEVEKRAQAKYGDTTDVPVSTFNKVWIVPNGARVFEKDGFAYITGSKLKVMLEEDYLAMENNLGLRGVTAGESSVVPASALNQLSSDVFREIILPQLEKEVNEGKNFAPVRQVYQSVILATWYKRALKDSLLGKIYADRSKVEGIESGEKDIKQKVYEQYLEAFRKGVYNVIKEVETPDGDDIIPRKYFSGGITSLASTSITAASPAEVIDNFEASLGRVSLASAATVEQEAEGNLILASSATRAEIAMTNVGAGGVMVGSDEMDKLVSEYRNFLLGEIADQASFITVRSIEVGPGQTVNIGDGRRGEISTFLDRTIGGSVSIILVPSQRPGEVTIIDLSDPQSPKFVTTSILRAQSYVEGSATLLFQSWAATDRVFEEAIFSYDPDTGSFRVVNRSRSTLSLVDLADVPKNDVAALTARNVYLNRMTLELRNKFPSLSDQAQYKRGLVEATLGLRTPAAEDANVKNAAAEIRALMERWYGENIALPEARKFGGELIARLTGTASSALNAEEQAKITIAAQDLARAIVETSGSGYSSENFIQTIGSTMVRTVMDNLDLEYNVLVDLIVQQVRTQAPIIASVIAETQERNQGVEFLSAPHIWGTVLVIYQALLRASREIAVAARAVAEEVAVASASTVEQQGPVGGINFDPTLLDLQIKRDGRGVPLPLPQQDVQHIDIKGLYPVIINIQPFNALPAYLGLDTPSPDPVQSAGS